MSCGITHGLALAKQGEHTWNFIQIQCAHLVPVEGYDKVRVRTGYERVLAHRCSKNLQLNVTVK